MRVGGADSWDVVRPLATTVSRLRLRRKAVQPRRVVVVGASLAGAFAAAAACGDGRTVTVLERDVLPDGPTPRDGVPQGRQPHVFLYRGLLAVEELLPGLRAELLAAGAVPLDTGDLAWLGEFGWAPFGRREFEVLSASRPLFEHVVVRRVRGLAGVHLRDGVRVTSVRRGEPGGPRWRVDLDDGSTLPADMVVDASGRGSRLPAWLAAEGVPPARTSKVDARVGYATRVYAVRDSPVRAAGIVLLQTPATLAGGIALPVEGDRWLVGAIGAGERRPPRDAAGFAAFLAALRDTALADLVAGGVPEDGVAVHRQTGNLRHHYEALRSWPDGLLVVGDALCAFNPVYGQGITVAACEALLLRQALARGLRPGDERRLLRRFGSVAALPWAIATGEDLRYPTSEGTQSAAQALLGRWTRELGRLSVHGDARAQATLSRVYHLMAPPVSLFHPALLAAAARARVLGVGPPCPRPQTLGGGRRGSGVHRSGM
jgi:2-polyprenyl-6-methoxyphenol hydroxylase-like FAD-dependent oxidoreductase